MCFRLVLLVALLAGLAGCAGNQAASNSATLAPTSQRLPAEVTGDPASALPKQKGR